MTRPSWTSAKRAKQTPLHWKNLTSCLWSQRACSKKILLLLIKSYPQFQKGLATRKIMAKLRQREVHQRAKSPKKRRSQVHKRHQTRSSQRMRARQLPQIYRLKVTSPVVRPLKPTNWSPLLTHLKSKRRKQRPPQRPLPPPLPPLLASPKVTKSMLRRKLKPSHRINL